ncbi:class I SAM-dependent methyltransferase [Patescibacteria group bacterium]|nr:class I SAM-dependent methyltransferase [Patescibacteria group bacterium]HRX17291.1 class I SAM-dependent methyltransferase [Spirochaetota bacterium]
MNESTRDYYNAYGEEWGKIRYNSFFHEENFRKFIGYLKKGDSILDIGCANGISVPLFLGIGHSLQYEGLDISETLLTIARNRYPNQSFLLGDIADASSLLEKTYDGFWAPAVLMHVPRELHNDLFHNLASIMKSGAYGYVTLPEAKKKEKEDHDTRTFEFFSIEEARDMFTSRGWKVLESGPLEGSPRNVWNWFIVSLPE